MKSVLRIHDLNDEVTTSLPDDLFCAKHFEEWEIHVDNHLVKGTTKEILLNGILIAQRQDAHLLGTKIDVRHDFPFLKMQFEIEGHSEYLSKNSGSLDLTVLKKRHQLFFFPEVNGVLHYPKGRRRTLEIILSLRYLIEIFNHDLSGLQKFGKSIEKNIPARLFPESAPITPEMTTIIRDIQNCHYNGVFRKIYLESKVRELLVLQIAQCNDQNLVSEVFKLSKADSEKLLFVKDILLNHPESDYSIPSIAEMVGLNDFKLKKGFRLMFNTTVFGYLTDVRMEKARFLISDGEFSIAEIANSIGYKNPQHFTVAFKRKYGVLPSAVQKHYFSQPH